MTRVREQVQLDDTSQADGRAKITWFSADEAPDLLTSGAMTPTALSAEIIELVGRSSLYLGNCARVLFRGAEPDGFSIVHAWFGENFPLPRHKHAGHCLYYVLRGELRMGSKTVREGDGLFVPSGRAYTYRAGPGGVEVLEFRMVSSFDMDTLDQDLTKWESHVKVGDEMAEVWRQTQPEWVQRMVTDDQSAGLTAADEK